MKRCHKCNNKLYDDYSKSQEDLLDYDESRKIVKKIAVVLITIIIISSAIVIYLF